MDDELGNRLRETRERLMLTQQEAADELGIHVRSVQDYEAGRAMPRAPRRRQLLAWLEQHEANPVAA